MGKKCSKCGFSKPLSDFYEHCGKCKSCKNVERKKYTKKSPFYDVAAKKKYYADNKEQIKERIKIRTSKTKIKAVNYKGGKCSCCGYNNCMAALDFHHINPCIKDENIGRIYSWAWDRLIKELDKCILLCANCHRELHYMNDF